jgi:glutathione S-transferase
VGAQITLYSFVPFDRGTRVRWLARELGIDVEERKLDYAGGEHRREQYLAMHPFGLVPTAVVEDEALWESGAICQIIAEGFPDSGLCATSEDIDYPRYLSWLFFSASTFDAAAFQVFRYHSLKPDPARRADAEADLMPLLVQLSRHLDRNQFLMGDRFMLPDILLGHAIQLLYLTRALDQYPIVLNYRDRLAARPGARAAGLFTPRPGG